MDFAPKKNDLLWEKKDTQSSFPFFISNKFSSEKIIHNLLGTPKIPIFGKYSRDGYILDEVKGVLLLELKNELFSNELEFQYKGAPKKITIPKEVKYIIDTIPEKIPHNKPINQSGNNFNKNKDFNKNYKKQEIFDFHPFKFSPLPKIKFVWSINFPNTFADILVSENKQNKSKIDNNFKNIINHTWVFENIDFSSKKKLINNIPCCVIIPKNIEKTCGVEMYLQENKGINFGSLRSEYLSTHLNQGALCLSPNNFRIKIDKTQVISHFWSVYLQPDVEHLLIYQWYINEMEEIFLSFLTESKTIDEFLMRCGSILGEKHEAIQQIIDLFS